MNLNIESASLQALFCFYPVDTKIPNTGTPLMDSTPLLSDTDRFTSGRLQALQQLANQTYDVLVIGGGITGAGIALDAQARGMKAALIEMQDFASGTSSRSTKLIHGGLRYLKQLEFKLVAEVGQERAIVFENGRHVTRAEKMLLPLYEEGSIGYWGASAGLLVYDLLAGVKKTERRKMLTREQMLTLEPSLNPIGLKGGVEYFEYRTDDARLTIEVLKEAVHKGAVACNYLKATGFRYQAQNITGVLVQDILTHETFTIHAHQIINAAGPWVDAVDVLDKADSGNKLYLTKGVHIVVPQSRLPIKHSIYFDVSDGRMVFAIPRNGIVYVGTTDTAYTQDLTDPRATNQDKLYLLNAINNTFPKALLTLYDISAAWAGIRPLIRQKGKSPSEVSRKDEIFVQPSGLISIAGGKLTGYRLMAQRVVDLALRRAVARQGVKYQRSNTKKIRLSGGHYQNEEHYISAIQSSISQGQKIDLTKEETEKLACRYGTNFHMLLQEASIFKRQPSNFPLYLQLEMLYCIKHEYVVTLSDYFVRRTGALYFETQLVSQYKNEAADFMGKLLLWTPEQKEINLKVLEQQLTDMVGE